MPAVKKKLTPKTPKQEGNSARPYARAREGIPDERIERWPLAKVLPYAQNPRAISDRAVSKVAVSIREFGFQQPIVVDREGVIIVGHTRRRAAELLGMETVPVIVADLSEEKARAYRLADNRTHEEADWLDDLLGDELAWLQEKEFNLDFTGFDSSELDRLIKGGSSGAGGDGAANSRNMLADKFMIPPFSVLNAREGWWQERKREWIALGIQSELGRGNA
jgi:hypothetical protein